MRIFVIYLLSVILVLFMGSSILSANSAFGLSCDASNMTWSFEETDVIFLGKALSKEYQPNPIHEDRFDAVTLFSIIEPYKGIYQKEISIISSEWLWGVNFTENSDYVVFANNNDGMFEHALCTPTRLASESNMLEIQKISQRYILPPLVQLEFGVSSNEIQCKQNLVLIQKYDGSPACVTESTKIELIKRGWVSIDSYQDYIGIEKISGGKITNISIEQDDKFVLLQLEANSDGHVIVTIPRIVLENMSGEKDSDFFVLVNGKEVNFDETITDTARTIRINFNSESEKIEIILPELI